MGDVNLPPISSKKRKDDDDEASQAEKWAPKNWKFFKKTDRDLRKMAPQLRSRYLAYEDPPKDASNAQANTRKRLSEKHQQKQYYREQDLSDDETDEKIKQEKLIGQLKAAEAKNRIRIMRLRYQANRAQEINHLIACQPTARQAVRLQALVPAKPEDRSQGDKLDKLSRARVEALLEDTQGLLTLRT